MPLTGCLFPAILASLVKRFLKLLTFISMVYVVILPTKFRLVKAMAFPVVMYRWTIVYQVGLKES